MRKTLNSWTDFENLVSVLESRGYALKRYRLTEDGAEARLVSRPSPWLHLPIAMVGAVLLFTPNLIYEGWRRRVGEEVVLVLVEPLVQVEQEGLNNSIWY